MEEPQHQDPPPLKEVKPAPASLKSLLKKLRTLQEKEHVKLVEVIKHINEPKSVNSLAIAGMVGEWLEQAAYTFDQCIKALEVLSPAFDEARIRSIVTRSIYQGFETHWNKQQESITEADRAWALGKYTIMCNAFLDLYLKSFFVKEFAELHSKRLQNEVWDFLDTEQPIRALRLIKGFHLLPHLNEMGLIKTLIHYDLSNHEIEFLFTHNKQLKEEYAKLLYRKDFKAAVNFIHHHKLDTNLFPGMVWELEKGWMSYCMRTFSLDMTELKFKHDPRYLSYLVIRNLGKNKRFAESLLMKYNLYENEVFVREGYRNKVHYAYIRRSSDTIIPNELVERDVFGPTESLVLNDGQTYLELKDLGINEKDVVLVDRIDAHFEFARNALSAAQVIGLDCEFTSAYTKFHKPSTLNIIQLSTYDKVFLLDAQLLGQSEQLKQLLKYVFFEHPTNTIVGFSAGEDLNLIRECVGAQKSMECPRFVDVQRTIGGKKNPSLKSCVEDQFKGKKFSKFEQCSGWNGRPFRRTQLHYAALDARVLLALYDEHKNKAVLTRLGEVEKKQDEKELNENDHEQVPKEQNNLEMETIHKPKLIQPATQRQVPQKHFEVEKSHGLKPPVPKTQTATEGSQSTTDLPVHTESTNHATSHKKYVPKPEERKTEDISDAEYQRHIQKREIRDRNQHREHKRKDQQHPSDQKNRQERNQRNPKSHYRPKQAEERKEVEKPTKPKPKYKLKEDEPSEAKQQSANSS